MFCPQCGASNADLNRYCVACGVDMAPDAYGYGSTAPPPSPYQRPVIQQAPYGQLAYPQPLYQQGPYQSPVYRSTPINYGMPVSLPTYLGWSIATLILCFWPASVVALVYGAQVNGKLLRGDHHGAVHSSRRAKLWCWISFGVAIALWVIVIIAIIALAALGARTSTPVTHL